MDIENDGSGLTGGEVFVPSSQRYEPSSEPPRKKRRTRQILADSDDEISSSQASESSVILPTSTSKEFIAIDDELLGQERSKYEHVLHKPAFVESQKNEFVTQIDQPWSSPTRIRGPRWRKKSLTPSPSPETRPGSHEVERTTIVANLGDDVLVADDFDDDEIEALMADQDLGTSASISVGSGASVPALQRQSSKNMRQTTLFGLHTTQRQPQSRPSATQAHNWRLAERDEPPTHHKIDEVAMRKWIFPLNVGTIRDYQYNIVHKALYNNILVALPTGLGKTFIAASVMMNWYNWTKSAQIVFMAPTKPLVAQQIEACFHIAGIPRSQTTLMTGEIPPDVRREEWQTKRVFFMTPQTMINDLKTGIADPKRIVLVVVDEAHKAQGNYAYVEIVRFLHRFNLSFRVLALTATPGSTVETVQKVVDGLDIARVEIRTEDSIDIQAFVHQRNIELELFDYSDEIQMCLDLFSKAVKPVLDKLCSQNASWMKDPTRITLFGLMQAKKQWFASDAGRKASQGVKGMVLACFQPLLPLAHNLELLKFHGVGPFYRKMKVFQDESGKGQGAGRAGGRPPSETRIMVFAHYRESAEEICRVLNRHEPMIRAHVFVGQSNTKGSDGMDQKKQTEIIKKFKAGTYNTIVATSIGEEGLDIGEVDLIVCYDCSKSPIRMLQRMGRTGRKRAGNIVMLLMRDKEEGDYYKAKDNYQKMQEMIESGKEFTFHTDRSPRIVPKSINPSVSKEHVDIPIENTQPGSVESVEPKRSRGKNKKKPPKKFHMPDNVETGFTFLGTKKKKSRLEEEKERLQASKHKKKRDPSDEDIAVMPADSEILLTPAQEADLEARYATIPGTEEQFIQAIDVRNQPEKLRRLDKTTLVGHSKATRDVVQAFGLARNLTQYKQRPIQPAEEDLRLLYRQSVAELQQIEAPFYVSQTNTVAAASQADALPELNNLFGSPAKTSKEKPNQAKKRASKRVISDDDDDG
ncbi:3'-5' DNA helicase [Lithohypha guttulata]|uniref:ATP-dependent DNA helicase n=1 Tax=Lithohypha guttulata TaxID=1690604 RepID=A0AAN7YJ00_9EURO|nr:3'-5' DNA helicase [Lithohypha guttulata]